MTAPRGPGRIRVRSADDALPPGAADLFVSHVRPGPDAGSCGYPYDLPAARALRAAEGLALDRPVTFLVGHNGSGKSTLVEGLAVAPGLNPESGSASFRFATADAH